MQLLCLYGARLHTPVLYCTSENSEWYYVQFLARNTFHISTSSLSWLIKKLQLSASEMNFSPVRSGPFRVLTIPWEGCLWLAECYSYKTVKRKKIWRKWGNFRNTYLMNYWADFLQIWYICRITHMEDVKYENLIEISSVVIEIRGIENGNLVVTVNNTLVHCTAFLATDTQPCSQLPHTQQ